MSTLSAPAIGDRASRIVLFVSLALNLFFLGVLGASAVRQLWPAAAPAFQPSASAAERIDRLAATLPAEDAEKLRGEFRVRAAELEKAHAGYRLAQDAVRASLRAEPFDAGVLRAAMADRRAARQTLDLALNDVITAAAARMSPAGREKLASWTPPFGGAQPK